MVIFCLPSTAFFTVEVDTVEEDAFERLGEGCVGPREGEVSLLKGEGFFVGMGGVVGG